MSKKTETIEIRLSPELKSDLSALSQGNGKSMSDVVRGLIESEVRGPYSRPPHAGDRLMTRPNPARLARAALIALPVAALSLFYLVGSQAPVSASPEFRVFFAELDRDGDRMVTVPEYAAFLTEEEDFVAPEGCAAGTAQDPCTAAEQAAEDIARIDSDGDGMIAYDELEAVLLRDRAEDFLEADFNDNGFVTADEYAALSVLWILDEPEIAAAEGVTLGAECQALLDSEKVAGAADLCAEDPRELRLEMAEYDADRDGRVSLKEFLEH